MTPDVFSRLVIVSNARRQLDANPSVSRGLVGFFYVAFEGNDSLSLCKVYSVLHHFALLSKLFGYFEQVNSLQLLTTRVKPFCKNGSGDATGDRTQTLHLEGVACCTNSTMAPYKGSFPKAVYQPCSNIGFLSQ